MFENSAIKNIITASTAISREGGCFYHTKIIPLPYWKQVLAKFLLYSGVATLSIILCCIAVSGAKFVSPVDSIAFQMRLLMFPIFLGEASFMSADEKAAVLALNPLDYEEGYSRDTVLEAQEIIRRENTQKGKL